MIQGEVIKWEDNKDSGGVESPVGDTYYNASLTSACSIDKSTSFQPL